MGRNLSASRERLYQAAHVCRTNREHLAELGEIGHIDE